MNKTILAAAVVSMTFATANVVAEETCKNQFQKATVSGGLTTQSINEDIQVGILNIQITSVDSGEVLFSQLGAVVGEITGVVPPGPTNPLPVVTIDHDITFGDGVEIHTTGDEAVVFGNPQDCSVYVEETLDTFWATGFFRKASGKVIASGLINQPNLANPAFGCNVNTFSLDGMLCVAE